jgi:hypothetical protein
MPLWLFPLGLLVGVALISLGSVVGYLLAMAWAFVLVPHVGNYIRTHSGGRADDPEHAFRDVDTHYWRTTLR